LDIGVGVACYTHPHCDQQQSDDYPPATIAETSIDEFDDLINTNARAVFISMKYQLPHLVKTNRNTPTSLSGG